MSKENNYVVVTTVSSHRMRYVVPMDELQKLNPDAPVEAAWALDCVTCQEVKEFSQLHIGEQIIDAQVVNEDVIVNMFDSDNDYAKSWDREYKLQWIRHWKEQPTEEEKEAFEKVRLDFLNRKDTTTTS